MQYDMVFEGGGAKGMVFVGAFQELEARGHTPARVLGTSAGSIMATLLAAGYDAAEMAAALNEKAGDQPVFMGFLDEQPEMSKEEIQNSAVRALLRDVNMKFVPDGLEEKLDDAIAAALASSRVTSRIVSFIERGGYYGAGKFIEWLRARLNSGVYRPGRGAHPQNTVRSFGDLTLAEYHHATGCDLSLVAADTAAQQLLILNHRTAPDLPVVYATRMSMSVPLLWNEVVWQPEWGAYRGRDVHGHTVVDGGLLSNFPIELFLSNQPPVTAVMGDKVVGDVDLLGFMIDEAAEVPGAPAALAEKNSFQVGELHSIRRITNLLNTMMQAHDKNVIQEYERFVIRLPAKGYGTIEFGMSDARREALVAAGRRATKTYFDRLEVASGEVSFGLDAGAIAPEQADKIALGILGE